MGIVLTSFPCKAVFIASQINNNVHIDKSSTGQLLLMATARPQWDGYSWAYWSVITVISRHINAIHRYLDSVLIATTTASSKATKGQLRPELFKAGSGTNSHLEPKTESKNWAISGEQCLFFFRISPSWNKKRGTTVGLSDLFHVLVHAVDCLPAWNCHLL